MTTLDQDMNHDLGIEGRKAVSIRRFAYAADVSEPFVRKEIKNGNIKGTVKRGNRVLIPVESLEAYLRGE